MDKKIAANSNHSANPYLRTMNQDLARVKGESLPNKVKPENKAKQAAPPASLPVAESNVLKDKPKDKPKAKQLASKKPVQKKKYNKVVFILIGAIVLAIIGLGGFFYWYNYLKPINTEPQPLITHFECLDNQCLEIEGEGLNECVSDQDCLELIEPEALLPVSLSESIESEGLLNEELESLLNQKQAEDSLKQILIIQGNSYLSFDSLLKEMNLSFPEAIMSLIATSTNNYTLFSYGEGLENRLGLVIQMKQAQGLREELKNWELQMPQDLMPLLLQQRIPSSSSESFLDNTYQETAIRYLNFPTSDLALDYALIEDKLIITTSKKSMFKAIQELKSD